MICSECWGKVVELADGRLECQRCLRIVPDETMTVSRNRFRMKVFYAGQVLIGTILIASVALAVCVDTRLLLLLFTTLIPGGVCAWASKDPETGKDYDWVPPPPPHDYES